MKIPTAKGNVTMKLFSLIKTCITIYVGEERIKNRHDSDYTVNHTFNIIRQGL